MITIDRCICTQQTFADLCALAKANGLAIGALAERTRAGKNCGYCVAYLRRALHTGQTVFHEILDKEAL